MTVELALLANARQAIFANLAIPSGERLCHGSRMSKRRRASTHRMPHLRPWRESLGLSRHEVVMRMGVLSPDTETIDQATLAKWESGETRVTVEDLELLAKVYGVQADRLFFSPGDAVTPELLGAAHAIITSRDPEAVRAWLASGSFLPPADKK